MQYNSAEEYLRKVLSFTVNEKTASEEAEKITKVFPSGASLASADANVLVNLSDCNEKTADFIRLLSALGSRRITDGFKPGKKYTREEIERYICALLFHLSVESVYMITFDKSGKLISADLITEGTVNSSAFLPRKMADLVLRKRASSVILAHNHPSGNIVPSENDVAVTLHAQSVLNDAHVRLDAHYIVVGFEILDCMGRLTNPLESSSGIVRVDPLK